MCPARSVALALLGLALLWSTQAGGAPAIGDADGWYKWQIDGAATTLFLHQESGKPTRVRVFSPDCRPDSRGITGEVTDMGSLSLDDSVALLLDIANDQKSDMDVREEALFGLAQSDSDIAYDYIDRLLFGT